MPILDQDSDLAAKRRRDDNARLAMQGMLGHPTRYKPRPNSPESWHDAIAQEAYEIADAMERARQLPNPHRSKGDPHEQAIRNRRDDLQGSES